MANGGVRDLLIRPSPRQSHAGFVLSRRLGQEKMFSIPGADLQLFPIR